MLAQAERFMESQGFHLLTKEEIPKFARCATEAYGNIAYALDDYFVGRQCTKDELWEMWMFNLKYFYSRALIYSDSPNCNAWLLWIPPDVQGQHLVGKLLKPMLEYCAQGGRPVYQETHSEKNVGIYRHFGFEVVSNDSIPGTEVTHWGMVK